MDVLKEIEDHISSIHQRLLNNDIEKGKQLFERFDSLCRKFRGFSDPSFDLAENQKLLDDLLKYESEVCHLECMDFFYGYISRMYLQVGDPQKCIMYALAAQELNEKSGDDGGVGAAKMVMCDCAIAHDASSLAVELFKQVHPYDTDTIEHFSRMPNHNAQAIKKLMTQKRRPSSYKHLQSEDSKLLERKIRCFMVAQNMSRATAKRTVKSVLSRNYQQGK